MLHIVNGESTLHLLRQSQSASGDLLSWGDILMEGPIIRGLVSAEDWAMRAAGLERRFGIPQSDYLRGMETSLAALESVDRHDEATLWFEECWFCQIHLVFLLARLRGRDLPRLTLVCPDTERLGTLTPARLDELFAERQTVTPQRMDLAAAVWEAYSAADPQLLARLLDADFGAWPRLHEGILSHLRRFPSHKNGLNVLETAVLRGIAIGSPWVDFAALFQKWNASESGRALGLGDSQFAVYLKEMAAGPDPLVAIEKHGGIPHRQRSITETGRAVLR
ncbi:MAG: DUF1835 domain-containing protein, partial [Chloroflexi bacterium]|nr:DUF1835 domain-containing protein [Chloroflexota bacterium]